MLLYRLWLYLFTYVLLRCNTFFDTYLRCMSTLLRYLMPKRNRQLLTVVGKYLRVVRSARDRDISHTVIEQVLGSQLRIDMNQHAVGCLSLTGVTGHGITMIEMRIAHRINFNRATIVHTQLHTTTVDLLYRTQFAVGNLEFIIWCGELDAVAH